MTTALSGKKTMLQCLQSFLYFYLKMYECLISLNDQLYSVDNLCKGIDVTYKLLHALQLKYPVE